MSTQCCRDGLNICIIDTGFNSQAPIAPSLEVIFWFLSIKMKVNFLADLHEHIYASAIFLFSLL